MNEMNVGILHPGSMGISLAATANNSGFKPYWVPSDRSEATLKRAMEHTLLPAASLAELSAKCPRIISVCPPHAAVEVAQAVAASGFQGLYADVNAIAPAKSIEIGHFLNERGIQYVDGGIVGGPAWEPDSTWLYLSGGAASDIAEIFSKGPLETEILGEEIGKASALKMSFAAYTKGTTAMLCAIVASADQYGVRDALEKQWSRNGSSFAEQTRNRISRVTAKAWRFSGEMKEIAETLEAAGLPGGFHQASQEIYERMAAYKDAPEFPTVEEVLESLLNPTNLK